MVLSDIDQTKWSLGLTRVREALEILNHPEDAYKHILVAGTNGKGSTCIYLERILTTHGLTVGTTISPHLTHFSERFRINGREASDKELLQIRIDIEPIIKDIGLTYFEWCVVIASVLFQKNEVDVAIFEIGLGGRFDASNVMDPQISVITEISLDHTNYLGSTVELIAREKAAIARPGRPVITSATGIALEEIRKYADTIGAKLHVVNKVSQYNTGIQGSEQPMNSSLAIKAAEIFGVNLAEHELAYAINTAYLPGRHESIGGHIIMDVAHNPSSILVLTKYLDSIGFCGVGVCGILADKDYLSMIKMLKNKCLHLFIAPVASERSWGMNEMEQCHAMGGITICKNITQAFKQALDTGKDVVITGSFYCVGEVRGSIICQG